jgi:hypothetical protein
MFIIIQGFRMNRIYNKACSWLLFAFFIAQITAFAQNTFEYEDTADPPSANENQSDNTSSVSENPVENDPSQQGYESGNQDAVSPQNENASFLSSGIPEKTPESGFQNAIIEGVQLTAEPGSHPDEKIVAGYFIFRDKPSSYFYEVKLKEKRLIFEFNDTRVGSSPVPTASESPIKGFVIEQGKIDVNKAVKGLKPEWHDLIRIVFDLEAVPEIHVNDEYSIISFSFKWSSDPDKQAKYTLKDQTPKVILWSTAGVGGIALGVVTYFLLNPNEDEKPLTALPTDDLPGHNIPQN